MVDSVEGPIAAIKQKIEDGKPEKVDYYSIYIAARAEYGCDYIL